MGRIRLPVVTAAYSIEAGMGLFTGDGTDGGGFIHPVADKNRMLLGNILRLYPLGQLIRYGKRNRTLFYHSGNDFLRQMLLRGQRLRASGLGDIIRFGEGISGSDRTVLLGVLLICKEGVSLLAGTDRASGFLPFIKGAGVGDFRILFVKNEKVPGALRGAVRHEIQKTFHGSVILEHRLGLRIHPRPNFFTLGLLHGGVFFLGQLGLFLLRFLFLSD